jgi:DNA-binding ferritin-like protein
MSAADIHFFFTLRSQIKLYHWQTYQFARHKATDDLISALDELMDNYVEVYMGKYGRPKMTSSTNSTSVKNMSESTATTFVRGAIKYLETTLVKRLKPTDTDLVNIRDEMLSNLNKLLYLFTLK